MLFARPAGLFRAACSASTTASSCRPLPLDARCVAARSPGSPTLIAVRHATHGAQGRANGPKNGPGQRLGAKKSGDEYVIPGNIIFRQRGTHWFPGENVGMGRDHTIFSMQTGYVKYYRNPRLHPKRRYIGVVFDKTQTLPTPLNAARRRRLGMVAVPRADWALDVDARVTLPGDEDFVKEIGLIGDVADVEAGLPVPVLAKPSKREVKEAKRKQATGRLPSEELQMRPNYSYRESNWEIGRAAERAGVQVNQFSRGDRFLAWRKKSARKARNAEKRALGKKKGAQKKARKQAN